MKSTLSKLLLSLALGGIMGGCANEIPVPVDGDPPNMPGDPSEPDLPGVPDEPDMPDTPDPVEPDMPEDMPDMPDTPAPLNLVGQICNEDTECAAMPGASCAKLMGQALPGICTLVGCNEGDCPEGSVCRDAANKMVCLPGSDDFCTTQCGEALECALKLECIQQGCCGSGPCPSVCETLSFSECEMNALCSAECCTMNQ